MPRRGQVAGVIEYVTGPGEGVRGFVTDLVGSKFVCYMYQVDVQMSLKNIYLCHLAFLMT